MTQPSTSSSGDPPFCEGDRIELLAMAPDDPDPVPPGTTGTVLMPPLWVHDAWQVCVAWDDGRSLNLVVPPDRAVKLAPAPRPGF